MAMIELTRENNGGKKKEKREDNEGQTEEGREVQDNQIKGKDRKQDKT